MPPRIKTPEQAPPILSFEEFTAPDKNLVSLPHYNNFFLCFGKSENFIYEMYRNLPHVKRFIAEHPDMYEKICKHVEKIDPEYNNKIHDHLPELEPELYEAYKIMKGYGFSDEALFA